ncbi:MAG: hypothetical protein A2Y45_05545 [Tenericutes bacterium GWC2_34_14]|nr:MAG: hypothetical protein A2Z84_08045 [Tenericutes bacterium GWA2_35_7]OHE28418.1 MAG: hypothetical protein A2Y45_05545 [Tenericutes bacterium GWC2_34_14]OHE33674.1 MAG: hypothetical protein A2012_04265 [Tenericutes bacterium GWE2_34_108]OHE36959.1 MAG: hypothetical protein A2Y46_10065 [Tenericutes bacterium GWF1_35_14]OHE37961.1 MAG: hypothetical protein A2Y44_08600 [Tenericutes bacterium GWF2_35_184]OHE41138.1 MAG: hypothetical protein A3K26_01605 [Tenericutes bacterium RIFOXYA12_FULL_35_
MRKYDIFGKKISQIKFVYSLVVVFLIAIAGYFLVINIQQNRLYELEQQEKKIQRQIDTLLETDQPVNYEEIEELLPFIPTHFDQYQVSQELQYVLNASSFQEVNQYNVTYSIGAANPFDVNLPATIEMVRISIQLSVSEPEKLLDYLDILSELDRFYYVDQMNVTFTTEGAITQIILFTFYNPAE